MLSETLALEAHCIELQGRVSGGVLVHTAKIRLQAGRKMIHVGDGAREPDSPSCTFPFSHSVCVLLRDFIGLISAHQDTDHDRNSENSNMTKSMFSLFQARKTGRLHEVTRRSIPEVRPGQGET